MQISIWVKVLQQAEPVEEVEPVQEEEEELAAFSEVGSSSFWKLISLRWVMLFQNVHVFKGTLR